MEYQSDAYMEAENDNQSETSEVDGSDIKVPTAYNILGIQRLLQLCLPHTQNNIKSRNF